MRIIKKNVYYCSFCKKKGLRSLILHEKHCTGNPDRECRMCGRESIKDIIEKYKAMFHIEVIEGTEYEGAVQHDVRYKKKFTVDDIKNEIESSSFGEHCPNCMLAIIRAVGLNHYWMKDSFKYDYKKEVGEWWANKNAEDEQGGYY